MSSTARWPAVPSGGSSIPRRPNRPRPWSGPRLAQGLSCSELLHLLAVEYFPRQQLVGDSEERRLAGRQDLLRALVVPGDDALHLLVDLNGRIFAVIPVLSDLASKEDLLFLFAEGQRVPSNRSFPTR